MQANQAFQAELQRNSLSLRLRKRLTIRMATSVSDFALTREPCKIIIPLQCLTTVYGWTCMYVCVMMIMLVQMSTVTVVVDGDDGCR